MITPRPGDRVHVEFDGIYRHDVDDRMHISVTDAYFCLVPTDAATLTVLRAPLQVGDVLTADDPEPPEGTVVIDRLGNAAKRYLNGWAMATPANLFHRWAALALQGPLTVVWLPVVSS